VIKNARCIAVYGRRGSGKSTLVKRLIADAPRLVVFDPVDEYGGVRGIRRAPSLKDVRAMMRVGWASGFKIAYITTSDHPRMLHGLADLIWQAQAPYGAGRDRRKVVLVVEEMNLGFPAFKLPAQWFAMGRAVLQGRHRGIEVIGVTQRPALVSTDFRGNVAETYALALATSHDYRAVFEVYGREAERALRSLAPHNYIHFSGGSWRLGANPAKKILKGKTRVTGRKRKTA